MGELFDSGIVVDILLLLIVAEGVLLQVYRRVRGRGVPLIGLISNLAAGGFLLLALRAALTGTDWPQIALWLATALIAHLWDLRGRWCATAHCPDSATPRSG
jgi:hypothetical protein